MRFGLRELVFCLVLLGLPVAAYFFVFKPANLQVEQVKRENRAKQARLEQLEVARHIEDLGEEIEKLTKAIDLFEDKLPTAKEVDVILREVWQLAVQRGLASRSVRPEKPIKAPTYSEQPIKMEIIGDFDGFYNFLLDLEKLDRITCIREMKLTKSNDAEGFMKAAFTLCIFFEPQSDASSNNGI